VKIGNEKISYIYEGRVQEEPPTKNVIEMWKSVMKKSVTFMKKVREETRTKNGIEMWKSVIGKIGYIYEASLRRTPYKKWDWNVKIGNEKIGHIYEASFQKNPLPPNGWNDGSSSCKSHVFHNMWWFFIRWFITIHSKCLEISNLRFGSSHGLPCLVKSKH